MNQLGGEISYVDIAVKEIDWFWNWNELPRRRHRRRRVWRTGPWRRGWRWPWRSIPAEGRNLSSWKWCPSSAMSGKRCPFYQMQSSFHYFAPFLSLALLLDYTDLNGLARNDWIGWLGYYLLMNWIMDLNIEWLKRGQSSQLAVYLWMQDSIISQAMSFSRCSRCLPNSASGQCRSRMNDCRASSFQNRSSDVEQPFLNNISSIIHIHYLELNVLTIFKFVIIEYIDAWIISLELVPE